MLRDCKVCGPVGLAVCVCGFTGEVINSANEVGPLSGGGLYVTAPSFAQLTDGCKNTPESPPPDSAATILPTATATVTAGGSSMGLTVVAGPVPPFQPTIFQSPGVILPSSI